MAAYTINVESRDGSRGASYLLNIDQHTFKRLDYFIYDENIKTDALFFSCRELDSEQEVTETWILCHGTPTQIINELITRFPATLINITSVLDYLETRDMTSTVSIIFKYPQLISNNVENDKKLELSILRDCVQPIIQNLFNLDTSDTLPI